MTFREQFEDAKEKMNILNKQKIPKSISVSRDIYCSLQTQTRIINTVKEVYPQLIYPISGILILVTEDFSDWTAEEKEQGFKVYL